MTQETKTIITLLKDQRDVYTGQMNFHFRMVVAFVLLFLLDFIVIVYFRFQSLDWYGWSGIIILFVLMGVESIQYTNAKRSVDSLDMFYLKGEYETQTKDKSKI